MSIKNFLRRNFAKFAVAGMGLGTANGCIPYIEVDTAHSHSHHSHSHSSHSHTTVVYHEPAPVVVVDRWCLDRPRRARYICSDQFHLHGGAFYYGPAPAHLHLGNNWRRWRVHPLFNERTRRFHSHPAVIRSRDLSPPVRYIERQERIRGNNNDGGRIRDNNDGGRARDNGGRVRENGDRIRRDDAPAPRRDSATQRRRSGQQGTQQGGNKRRRGHANPDGSGGRRKPRPNR